MNAKEQFIKEVMESIDSIKRAEVSPLFNEKLNRNWKLEIGNSVAFIRPQLIWKFAASVALLIAINIFSWVNYSKTNKSDKQGVSTFAKEYFSYFNDKSNIY
jgi:hypothetical protein